MRSARLPAVSVFFHPQTLEVDMRRTVLVILATLVFTSPLTTFAQGNTKYEVW